MALVLALAGALWGLGHLLRLPVSGRLMLVGLLYVAVLMLQVALPAGHPLRQATGGSAGEWLVLGSLAALVWAYSKGLKSLKARVRPENLPREAPASGATELERNARHIGLREIGGPGQKRLKEARVLVIGASGLGAQRRAHADLGFAERRVQQRPSPSIDPDGRDGPYSKPPQNSLAQSLC